MGKIIFNNLLMTDCMFFNFQWASCHVTVDTDLIHSTLNYMVSLLHSSTSKGPPLSATSALLSQVTSLLPASSTDQNDAVSNKRKMWSEVNRRKTFNNWPHRDYKWAVPDTMAQAGFYHQVRYQILQSISVNHSLKPNFGSSLQSSKVHNENKVSN